MNSRTYLPVKENRDDVSQGIVSCRISAAGDTNIVKKEAPEDTEQAAAAAATTAAADPPPKRSLTKLAVLEMEIRKVEKEQGEVQAAMEKKLPHHGMSDHRMLEDNLRRLWRKEEQLRTKEEQLRQKELLLLRSADKVPLDACEPAVLVEGDADRIVDADADASSNADVDADATSNANTDVSSNATADADADADSVPPVQEPEPMTCKFQTVGGKILEVEGLYPHTTVQHLKTIMREQHGLSEAEQAFLFAGRQLQDGRTLGEYKISHECMIQTVLRILGPNPRKRNSMTF